MPERTIHLNSDSGETIINAPGCVIKIRCGLGDLDGNEETQINISPTSETVCINASCWEAKHGWSGGASEGAGLNVQLERK